MGIYALQGSALLAISYSITACIADETVDILKNIEKDGRIGYSERCTMKNIKIQEYLRQSPFVLLLKEFYRKERAMQAFAKYLKQQSDTAKGVR